MGEQITAANDLSSVVVDLLRAVTRNKECRPTRHSSVEPFVAAVGAQYRPKLFLIKQARLITYKLFRSVHGGHSAQRARREKRTSR